MSAMLFVHRWESIAPEGAPTNPSLHLAGTGHARDAFRTRSVRDALHRRPQPPDGGDALRAMPARILDVGGRHAADGIDRQ